MNGGYWGGYSFWVENIVSSNNLNIPKSFPMKWIIGWDEYSSWVEIYYFVAILYPIDNECNESLKLSKD